MLNVSKENYVNEKQKQDYMCWQKFRKTNE